MPQINLTPTQRREKRADAHHLDPVVMVGGEGLTPAVVKETDAALNAHGLIKVRVQGDDREAREAMFVQLCDELNAAPIQHIGKLLVLWRPLPEKEKKVNEDRMASLARTQGTPLALAYLSSRVSDPIELAGLKFPNRVGLAAGLDKNARCIDGLAAMILYGTRIIRNGSRPSMQLAARFGARSAPVSIDRNRQFPFLSKNAGPIPCSRIQ